MVMQFQGLENPVQMSLPHSHRLSGFVPDGMSVKPAKGRSLHRCPCVRLCYCTGGYTGLLLEVKAIGLCQREAQTRREDRGVRG